MQKLDKKSSFSWLARWWWAFGIGALYLITHLIALTALPIFADEAIYLWWAQLIQSEPARYAFFSINDGKTPLFIWLLLPFLHLIADPLMAGRMLSVLIGLLQVGVMGLLAASVRLKRVGIALAMLCTTLLPFWFFNARLALMDSLLVLFVSLTLLCVILLVQLVNPQAVKSSLVRRRVVVLVLLGGLSFGLAILTKLPAVLFIPVLLIWMFLPKAQSFRNRLKLALPISLIIGIGLGVFALLIFLPNFSQLFTRGGDFLLAPSQFFHQSFVAFWGRVFAPIGPLFLYLTPLVFLSPLIGIAIPKGRRTQAVLLLSIMFFLAPICLLGQVVYSRYLLPTAVFFTLSVAGLLSTLVTYVQDQQKLWLRAVLAVVIALFLANIIGNSVVTLLASYSDVTTLPLTASDKVQYLTEWSAGFGTKEAVDELLRASQTQRIAVATEGFFGSLPDGMLVYLHNQDVTNIYLEGIGQPVNSIPDWFIDKVNQSSIPYDQVWLVVNSHRLGLPLSPDSLKFEYCRPFDAPCLQVYDISQLVLQQQGL